MISSLHCVSCYGYIFVRSTLCSSSVNLEIVFVYLSVRSDEVRIQSRLERHLRYSMVRDLGTRKNVVQTPVLVKLEVKLAGGNICQNSPAMVRT